MSLWTWSKASLRPKYADRRHLASKHHFAWPRLPLWSWRMPYSTYTDHPWYFCFWCKILFSSFQILAFVRLIEFHHAWEFLFCSKYLCITFWCFILGCFLNLTRYLSQDYQKLIAFQILLDQQSTFQILFPLLFTIM